MAANKAATDKVTFKVTAETKSSKGEAVRQLLEKKVQGMLGAVTERAIRLAEQVNEPCNEADLCLPEDEHEGLVIKYFRFDDRFKVFIYKISVFVSLATDRLVVTTEVFKQKPHVSSFSSVEDAAKCINETITKYQDMMVRRIVLIA